MLIVYSRSVVYSGVLWQVSVESYDAGKPINLDLLDGTWRLQYTSAPDVVILLQSAATLPFFEVYVIDANPGYCI